MDSNWCARLWGKSPRANPLLHIKIYLFINFHTLRGILHDSAHVLPPVESLNSTKW